MSDNKELPRIENVDVFPDRTVPAAARFGVGASDLKGIKEATEARRENQRPADYGKKI